MKRGAIVVSVSVFGCLGLLVAAPSDAAIRAPITHAKVVFSDPNFRWFGRQAASTNTVSQAGDFWTQSFTVKGLPQVDTYDLYLEFDDTITTGQQLRGILVVNGTTIGDFPIGPCCANEYFFSSPAINGPAYNILILIIHGVDPTAGGITLHLDGPSYLKLSRSARH